MSDNFRAIEHDNAAFKCLHAEEEVTVHFAYAQRIL